MDPELSMVAMGAASGFGALAASHLPFLRDLRKEHLRKPNEASKYFEELAAALSSTAGKLREKTVPRVDGTRLNGLFQTFDQKVDPVGSKVPAKLKASLLGATKAAKTLDAWALDRIQLDEEHRELLMANIERAAGTCKALATKLHQDA